MMINCKWCMSVSNQNRWGVRKAGSWHKHHCFLWHENVTKPVHMRKLWKKTRPNKRWRSTFLQLCVSLKAKKQIPKRNQETAAGCGSLVSTLVSPCTVVLLGHMNLNVPCWFLRCKTSLTSLLLWHKLGIWSQTTLSIVRTLVIVVLCLSCLVLLRWSPAKFLHCSTRWVMCKQAQ